MMKRLIPFLLLLCFFCSSCGIDSSSPLFQQGSETESSQHYSQSNHVSSEHQEQEENKNTQGLFVITGKVKEMGETSFTLESAGGSYFISYPEQSPILAKGAWVDVFYQKSGLEGTLQAVEIQKIKEYSDTSGTRIGDFYGDALSYIYGMSLEQKIAQLFLVLDPDKAMIEQVVPFHPAGFLFQSSYAYGKTSEQWLQSLSSLKEKQNTPFLFIAETSSENSLYEKLTGAPFPDTQQLYTAGGITGVQEGLREQFQWLKQMGLHAALGPDTGFYDHPQQNKGLLADSALSCLLAASQAAISNEEGIGLILHPFPGLYIEKIDELPVNNSPYEDFLFQDHDTYRGGLQAGADCLLLPNCIYTEVDPDLPASLSRKVMAMAETDGVLLSDDISDAKLIALELEEPASVTAIKAGAHLLLTSHFAKDYQELLAAAQKEEGSAFAIDLAVTKVVAWKMKLGLIMED